MAFPVAAPAMLISLGLQFLTIVDLTQKHSTMVNLRGSAAETVGAVQCNACSRHCAL
jgi:hypothetical protein